MSLLECLRSVEDPRRPEGRRTSLEQIMTMVILGYLCGYHGFRPLGTFVRAHADFFRQLLQLKHPVPSFVTLREVITRVDSAQLLQAFNTWAASFSGPGDWLCGDGKVLASTVEAEHEAQQDFAAVVSLFSQRTGFVQRLAAYRQAEQSEVHVLERLVQELGQYGAVITLDALHTQKNAPHDRPGGAPLPGPGEGQSTETV